jgi:hypothetical protein
MAELKKITKKKRRQKALLDFMEYSERKLPKLTIGQV